MAPRCDILTITPNPSIDLLHATERIAWDDANRVEPPRRRAGGQGVNLARAARSLGGSAHALLPLGGRTGQDLAALLEDEGLPFTATRIEGETRIFVAVHETTTGRSILINPRGPACTAADAAALHDASAALIAAVRPAWVACCGSVPPGMPQDLYAGIKRLAHAGGARFVADCDGEVLRHAAAGGCDLLKPNRFEAERLTGLSVRDVSSAVRAGRALVAQGTPIIAITLGEEGAVMVADRFVAHARVQCDGGSAVGAGDSLLASLLVSLVRSDPLDAALRDAVAAGASVLLGEEDDLMNMDAYSALRALVEVDVLEC